MPNASTSVAVVATHGVSRRAMLVDSNVLIAAFSPSDKARHGDSITFIENPDYFEVDQWLVPIVVVVEAWGMLLKLENRLAGLKMLAWLSDPGNPVMIFRHAVGEMASDSSKTTESVVLDHHVDVVDALLVATADHITVSCALNPFLRVATYDLRDFPRLQRVLNARVRILDMNSLTGELEL